MKLTEDNLTNFIMNHIEKPTTYEQLSKMLIKEFGILENQKLRERIERVKTHTKAILSDDSPNKEELQHLLSLFDFLLEESKK